MWGCQKQEKERRKENDNIIILNILIHAFTEINRKERMKLYEAIEKRKEEEERQIRTNDEEVGGCGGS